MNRKNIKQEQVSKAARLVGTAAQRAGLSVPSAIRVQRAAQKGVQFVKQYTPYSSIKSIGLWTLGPIALFLAWRAGQVLFGLAPRKCGVFTMGISSPGRDVCISRYRIQGLTKQLQALKQLKSAATSRGATKEQLKQIDQKIATTDSKLTHYNMKIKQILGKQATKSKQQYQKTTSKTREQKEVVNEVIPFVLPLAGLAFSIFAGILIDAVTFRTWRTLKMMFDQATRKCGVYKRNEEHDLCVSKVRLHICQRQLVLLQKMRTSCPKQKNPVKCQQKLDEEIIKMRDKIQLYSDNIIGLQNQMQQKKAMEAQK